MPAPRFIQSILSSFPLVEYPSEAVSSGTPAQPTLWILGPGIDREKESFDVDCLKEQAYAAFNNVKVDIRSWELSEGGPGGILPALHLPNGDLLSANGIEKWIHEQRNDGKGKERQEDSNDNEKQEEHVSVQSKTYTALVESKLHPALLAHLFLTPSVFRSLSLPLYFPQTLSHASPSHPPKPILMRLAYSAYSRTHKLEIQEEVRKKCSMGKKEQIDLEKLQNEGEEALELLEAKIADEGQGWFFGSAEPTPFDALLYAHLHIIYLLHAPHLDAPSPLRKKLSRCPQLLSWAKRLHKVYF